MDLKLKIIAVGGIKKLSFIWLKCLFGNQLATRRLSIQESERDEWIFVEWEEEERRGGIREKEKERELGVL